MPSEQLKTAVVTGAGSGIGRASTQALSEAGFQIVLAGRRGETLEQTRDSLRQPEQSMIQVCDVTRVADVDQLFARTMESYGQVDVLFNNAGTNCSASSIEKIALDDWLNVMNVNVLGTFLCTQAAIRCMKAQQPPGGRIINNGSISAHVPRPWSAAYTASKHAVTGLTRSTALDGRSFNIACSQIDIGNAGTDMTQRMSDGVRQADGRLLPEPTMDVRHVARAVVQIASLPLDVNVPFMTIMATTMPYIGRG